MKKTIIYLLAFALIIGVTVGVYQYNKPHLDIADAKPEVSMSAAELFDLFSDDEQTANEKFAGKIVEVSGSVFSIENGGENEFNILLMGENDMFGVSCTFDSNTDELPSLKTGAKITVKGECAGMLSDVVLIRCVLVKP